MAAKILVCDDTLFMRNMVSEMLKSGGHEVVGEAGTGQEAVEQFEKLQPDLVTMDVVMPEMNGFDAVTEIKKRNPEARIVMCSAMGQETLITQALKAGAAGYVVKPFQADRLLEAVRDALA